VETLETLKPCKLSLFFDRLGVHFLGGFASGHALGDDQATGFDAQYG
jgi:hypothetical protein